MFEQQHISFFTATILSWKKLLQPDRYKKIITDSLNFLVKEKRFWVYGFVIMPNHIHILWKIREPYLRQNIQRDFLKYTAQQIKKDLEKNHKDILEQFKSTPRDRKYQIWERKPLSIYCYSDETIEQKLGCVTECMIF
jgi:REP element-mobilizing transposase RayT